MKLPTMVLLSDGCAGALVKTVEDGVTLMPDACAGKVPLPAITFAEIVFPDV